MKDMRITMLHENCEIKRTNERSVALASYIGATYRLRFEH